jgi:putative phosphoribosyl transferase
MFENRTRAGRALGGALVHLKSQKPLVIGLPRGGIPVAWEVAQILEAPLDVIVVRKLGVPGRPEYAMGAVGENEVRLIDWNVVSRAGVTMTQLRTVVEGEEREVRDRADKFRGGLPLDLAGRTVVIADDGIATGSTVTAAVKVARELGAGSVVVAAPVAPAEVVRSLRHEADEVVVLETPEPFYAVGQAYVSFEPTTDADVATILALSRLSGRQPAPNSAAG